MKLNQLQKVKGILLQHGWFKFSTNAEKIVEKLVEN